MKQLNPAILNSSLAAGKWRQKTPLRAAYYSTARLVITAKAHLSESATRRKIRKLAVATMHLDMATVHIKNGQRSDNPSVLI